MSIAHLSSPASTLSRLTEWAGEQWEGFSFQTPEEASTAQASINMAKIQSIMPGAMDDIKETVQRLPFTRNPGGGLTEAGEIFVIGVLGAWLKDHGVEIEESDFEGLKVLIKENEGKIAPSPDTGDEQASKRLFTPPASGIQPGAAIGTTAIGLGFGILMFLSIPGAALTGFGLQTGQQPSGA